MVAYSFRPRFIEPIITGTKGQTIRADGKRRHALPGQAVQLYTGMRTKYCRLIGRAICSLSRGVTLDFIDDRVMTCGTVFRETGNLDEFARLDGFRDWAAMKLFWAEEHPDVHEFRGTMIRWRDFAPAQP